MNGLLDRLARFVAWRLPRRVVLWTVHRGIAHASTGPWNLDDVRMLAAVQVAARCEFSHAEWRRIEREEFWRAISTAELLGLPGEWRRRDDLGQALRETVDAFRREKDGAS